jgi:hypothetical protein
MLWPKYVPVEKTRFNELKKCGIKKIPTSSATENGKSSTTQGVGVKPRMIFRTF